MEENLRQYELNYILSPDSSQEEILSFSQKFRDFINEIQGKIEESRDPKIQKLAFPIKKFGQGYFGEIRFLAEPAKISELEKKLKLEEKILRFSMVVIPPIKQGVEKPPKKPKIYPAGETKKKSIPRIGPETKKEKIKKEKVKLEDIDKKLEEIIGNI